MSEHMSGTTCMGTTGNAVTLCSLWFKGNVKMLNSLLFFVVVVVVYLFFVFFTVQGIIQDTVRLNTR